MPARDSFCSFCGDKYPVTGLTYPKVCTNCNTTVWSNPIPVSVVLLPIVDANRKGLMVIRRGIEPKIGQLALLGGFLEDHESWQAGGAREVLEEAGLTIDASTIEPLWFCSTQPKPNRVLLFGIATPLLRVALPRFTSSHEAQERGVVFGPQGLSDLFAFQLHVEAANRFFARMGVAPSTPADYQQC